MPRKNTDRISFGIGTDANLVDALNSLVSTLLESNRQIDDEKPYLRALGMLNALEATEKFMQSIWQFNGMKLNKPYMKIHESINLMLDGTEVEEFSSLRKPKAETLNTQMFKSNCAAAMDLFMHNGANRMKAASRVAKLFPDLSLKAETIADWRDNLIGNSDRRFASGFKNLTTAFKQEQMPDNFIICWITHVPRRKGVLLKRQPNRVASKRSVKKEP